MHMGKSVYSAWLSRENRYLFSLSRHQGGPFSLAIGYSTQTHSTFLASGYRHIPEISALERNPSVTGRPQRHEKTHKP